MNDHLKWLLPVVAILFLAGCDSEIETTYENPASATSAAPNTTQGDRPVKDALEDQQREELIPTEAEILEEQPSEPETSKEPPTETPEADDSGDSDTAPATADEAPDANTTDTESSSETSLPDAESGLESEPVLKSESDDESESADVSPTSERPNGGAELVPASLRKDVPPADPANNRATVERSPAIAERPEGVVGARKIELLIEEKSFKRVGKEKVLQVNYDDIDLLKILNMEPVPIDAVNYFPQWLKDLDGKRIKIRGFMYPPLTETGIRKFMLARDNDICCFGRDPMIYDIIRVKMKEGVTTDYIANRPFDVIGRFKISPESWDDEKLMKLYEIEDAIIIDR